MSFLSVGYLLQGSLIPPGRLLAVFQLAGLPVLMFTARFFGSAGAVTGGFSVGRAADVDVACNVKPISSPIATNRTRPKPAYEPHAPAHRLLQAPRISLAHCSHHHQQLTLLSPWGTLGHPLCHRLPASSPQGLQVVKV